MSVADLLVIFILSYLSWVSLRAVIDSLWKTWKERKAKSIPKTVKDLYLCMLCHPNQGMADVVTKATRNSHLKENLPLNRAALGKIRDEIYSLNYERSGDPFAALVSAFRSVNAGYSNNPVEEALKYVENLMK